MHHLAHRDLTVEARAAWTSEIGPLFKDLHERFDTELSRVRYEYESQYKMKVFKYILHVHSRLPFQTLFIARFTQLFLVRMRKH